MSLIKIDNNIQPNSIYLNSSILKKANIKSKNIILHFGAFKKVLAINIDSYIQPADIIIPGKLTEQISIPDVPYDFYFRGNDLFLGPVIGFLTAVYYKNPRKAILRFTNYENIKGLIYIFKKESINMKNKDITGYYFEPQTKTFLEGIFPYPSSIFCQQNVNKKTFRYLNKHIGDKIFNRPCNIDKFSLWNILSKDSILVDHLPNTVEFKNVETLLQILINLNPVYLKPFNKAGGIGILHVKKIERNYMLTDIYDRKYYMENEKDVRNILKKKLKRKRKYLIQQDIPFTYQQQKVDFRIYLQKDYTKNWIYSGMETKIAKKESIISNKKKRSKMMPAEIALKEIFNLDTQKTHQVINNAVELCIKALKIIEENGYHLGDAAVDLIIDQNFKVWIIEVQLVYASLRKTVRSIDEQQVLPAVLPTPFEYAKALAGF
ncbi:YheC/YheD family protein [Candidatus Contubernalis alkaliaceticus]|uniref:YheC/YheD family protein n=1 Tax=Candidatus Contubernalis alkaliaceticus TaxID=338645 RepID=UPI001F4C2FB7|nr:YheC/YheD family protein [Candidatus Contubernalis alkalaceticus]UNC92229.1 YheC/YheD family protein [Candidatus Contubernalis alkalaceticus]